MNDNWIKIFATTEEYQVKIAEDVLKQHGIESHVVSRRDSALPSLGEVELYTLPEKAQRAVEILREQKILS
jgi:hypothetical protein